jgi:peroxiredoxin
MDELEDTRASTRRWRRATLWAAAFLAVAGLAYGLVRPAGKESNAGREAPTFTLERLDGGGTISSEDLRGGPVIVNFWGSWCDPCRAEMPLFERRWQEHRDAGLTIVGIDLRDAPDNAKEFVAERDITYPIVVDPEETVARQFGIGANDGLPQTFFIDSRWRFQAVDGGELGDATGTVVLGQVPEELLDEQIERLLETSR